MNGETLHYCRVRVLEGGHNIPTETIVRRYNRGLNNFFKYYKHEVDSWMLFDNSNSNYKNIAKGSNNSIQIFSQNIWNKIINEYEV